MDDAEIQQVQELLNQHLDTQRVREGESYYQEAGYLDFQYRVILGSKNPYLINMLCDGLYFLVGMYCVQLGMSGPLVSRVFVELKVNIIFIVYLDVNMCDL